MKCADCGQGIPAYEGGAKGFSKPSPPASARPAPGQLTREELAAVTFTQGVTGMTVTANEIVVCAECYLTEFKRIHPAADAPVMPKALVTA